MSARKNLIVVALVCGLTMAFFVTGANAVTLPQQTPGEGTTFDYQGQMKTPEGLAVPDGSYDFQFSLFDAPEGGRLLWLETQSGVPVMRGSFAVKLGSFTAMPAEAPESPDRYLAVSLRGPGETGFTTLNPRTPLAGANSAAAAADLTCPHSHFGDMWSGTNTSYGLYLYNHGTGDGLEVYSNATAYNVGAVFALNTANSGEGVGVYAGSYFGKGLYAGSMYDDGLEAVTHQSGSSSVYAHTDEGNGVYAFTNANGFVGVRGENRAASPTSASTYGGEFISQNSRALHTSTNAANWYSAYIEGGLGLYVNNCVGCSVAYIGQNAGDPPIRMGDLVIVTGVLDNPDGGQPVMQVRLAASAAEPVIGVAQGAAADPAYTDGPDFPDRELTENGQYMRIVVSGLAQVRVTGSNAVGDWLSAGPDGAVTAGNPTIGVARMLSAADENGLAWAMVNAR